MDINVTRNIQQKLNPNLIRGRTSIMPCNANVFSELIQWKYFAKQKVEIRNSIS